MSCRLYIYVYCDITLTYFFTGVLILIDVGMYIKWNMHLKQDTVHSKTSKYEIILPWALIISTLGGALCIVAASVTVFQYQRNRKIARKNLKYEIGINLIVPPRKTIMVDMATNTPTVTNHDYYNITFVRDEDTGDVVARSINEDQHNSINPCSF